jgi:hypothetical protein
MKLRTDVSESEREMTMLRIAFAVLLGATSAQAQPFPGPIQPYGGQDGRDYNDQQRMRRDYGLDYDQSINRPNVYQPYPSISPHIPDPSRRSPYSSPYGNDD